MPVPSLPPAKFVGTDGCRLAYFTLGEETGTPLVLCHGLAANGLQFVTDAQWFAQKGFFVIVPDIRGHGRSVINAAVNETDFSTARLAQDMLAVLDAEKCRAVHWAGNSLGGIIGLEIMGSTPERLLSFISFGTAYRLAMRKSIAILSGLGARLAGTSLIARIGAPMTCRTPEAQAIIAAMLLEADIASCTAIGAHVRQYDLIENALRFDRPILMLRGERDKAVNRALGPTLAAMRNRPGFTLKDIADAGHCANLDQPDIVRKAILDFITTKA